MSEKLIDVRYTLQELIDAGFTYEALKELE
ncbi:MAG: hypothetical protein PR2021_5490 [Candidatus Phytoplasma pruni]|nr:MAG: hypothetical protein PR2021_2260 [Candidatus Phytoplasma pruni]WEK82614.1 MAG: hypothetical protein PR2021_5490 [Candidatus Phytoplasma pruni]